MVSTAIAFVFVVLLFIRLAGDTGKALAMLLLALQISASGGVVPIELSGEFFSALSPWLPMTWMVHGLKAAIFDAYGGDWLTPLFATLSIGAASAVLAMGLGRWREARMRHLRPALDL
jgi:putative membrane protein